MRPHQFILENKHVINNKGFIHIFLLIAAILTLTIAGLWAWKNNITKNPSSPPTMNKKDVSTDWKTYTNNFQSYSIKIPPNWEVYTGVMEQNADSPVVLTSDDFDSNDGGFKIGVEYLDDDLTFEENVEFWKVYYFSSTAELGNCFKGNTSKETVMVDDRSGFSFKMNNLKCGDWEGRASWTYLPLTNEYLLFIKYSANNDELFDIFNQVLSTLEFLDNLRSD